MSELDPSLRALIDDARPDMDPPASAWPHVRANLARRIGPAALAAAIPATATAAGAAAAPASALGIVKVVGFLALVGSLGGGAYAVHVRTAAAPHVAAPATSVATPAPKAGDPDPPVSPPMALEPDVPSPAPAPETTSAAVAPSKASRLPGSTTARARAGSSDTTLEEEYALISDAQRALQAHDPSTALAKLDAHASRFPRGQLSEERDALRVMAVCSLGRPDAKKAAASFLRARPASPLASKIRKACGE
jgi:hypothetical protein